MKKKLLTILLIVLAISTCFFTLTACEKTSKGLTFEVSTNGTGYAVGGRGECFDKKIVIPSTYKDKPVVEIKNRAFSNDMLEEIIIPNSVTSIGEKAFVYCSSLTSIIVNENNNYYKSIDGNLYSKDGTTLIQYAIGRTQTSFTIPNSVTSIGSDAFYGCSSLTSVVIGNSVTSIGDFAFRYCDSLTSIEIPNSVTSIGYEAFFGCFKLVEVINKSTHITVTKGSTSNGYVGYYALAVYNSSDTFTGTKLSNDNDYIVYAEGNEKILVGYNGTRTNLIIPSYVTKINNYAFARCSSLTNVVIPDSVTSIGNSAFSGCSSLTNIEIPNSVTSIGSYAFYGCDSLTSIAFEDTSIWYITTNSTNWQNKTGGTSTNVTTPTNNDDYFKSTYYYYYWYKL